MNRKLYLVEDRIARGWEPFALTRPVGEMLFGALLLRERIERATGMRTAAYLGAPELEGFEEEGTPPVGLPDGETGAYDRCILLSRYVPPLSATADPALELPPAGAGNAVLTLQDGTVVGWILQPGAPWPPPDAFSDPDSREFQLTGEAGPEIALPGRVLESPWQLMAESPDILGDDLSLLQPGGGSSDALPLPELPGVHRVGDHPVSTEAGVVVDPSVVLDTRPGPIHLSQGVHLRPFTHLRGPAFVGRDSVLLGGVFEAISCGPVCKLRGEVDTTVVLGYSNKAHDGYLGHSLVGRWVNLGAFTTNSDLKNNYGLIRVLTDEGERETGLMKVGAFLGDHAKTGIGTLLNGGTIIGAGANVFGGRMPSKRVPAFGWGSGETFSAYRLDAFLDTAQRAMERRGKRLTSGTRALFSRAWESVHGPVPDTPAS